jgi:hypothetical protein
VILGDGRSDGPAVCALRWYQAPAPARRLQPGGPGRHHAGRPVAADGPLDLRPRRYRRVAEGGAIRNLHRSLPRIRPSGVRLHYSSLRTFLVAILRPIVSDKEDQKDREGRWRDRLADRIEDLLPSGEVADAPFDLMRISIHRRRRVRLLNSGLLYRSDDSKGSQCYGACDEHRNSKDARRNRYVAPRVPSGQRRAGGHCSIVAESPAEAAGSTRT